MSKFAIQSVLIGLEVETSNGYLTKFRAKSQNVNLANFHPVPYLIKKTRQRLFWRDLLQIIARNWL